jgi:hypothetical protein
MLGTRLSFAVLVFVSACVPTTAVRRTAFAPGAYLPARTGAPLAAGESQLSAEMSGGGAAEAFLGPEVGDPGLLTPELSAGASAYHAVSQGLELGAQVRYASYDWARSSSAGVLPFPSNRERDLWLVGAGARYNLRVPGTGFSLAALGELNRTTIHQATFVCNDPRCEEGNFTFNDGAELYEFKGMESETFTFGSLFLQPTLEAGYGLSFFSSLGIQGNIRNVGFDPDRRNAGNSTIEPSSLGIMGLGSSYRVGWLTTTISAFLPVAGQGDLTYGPAVSLQTAVQF